MSRREFLSLALMESLEAGQPPQVSQLEPEQMDAHLHSGMEREVPMPEWVDLAAALGRRALVLLDHLELYRPGQPPRRNYPQGEAGRRRFLDDVAAQRRRRQDLLIYSGWEVFEGELDTGLEMEALRLVDTLGWHISHYRTQRPPDGAVLIRRAEQLRKLQEELPVPMVLFHPFTPRLEGLERRGEKVDRANCRYFHGDQSERLIALLKGTDIYIEINYLSLRAYWDQPAAREALIAAIGPLAQAGLGFALGSDAHTLRHLRDLPFEPRPVLEACRVSPAHLRPYWLALAESRRKREARGRR